MKNADMPAMPLESGNIVWSHEHGWKRIGDTGLTKREHFASMAIPPMELIIEALKEHSAPFTLDDYIECAVSYKKKEADALLKELEK